MNKKIKTILSTGQKHKRLRLMSRNLTANLIMIIATVEVDFCQNTDSLLYYKDIIRKRINYESRMTEVSSCIGLFDDLLTA